MAPPGDEARLCTRANLKVRPHFLCLPKEPSSTSRRKKAEASQNCLPTLHRSCWLESWLHRAVCFGQMHYTGTVVGQCQGQGHRGSVHFQQRGKFSLQVVSGLRLPQGASCDLGSRRWPVGTHKMLGRVWLVEQLCSLMQKWAVCRIKQGSTDRQTSAIFSNVSIWVEFCWDGKVCG